MYVTSRKRDIAAAVIVLAASLALLAAALSVLPNAEKKLPISIAAVALVLLTLLAICSIFFAARKLLIDKNGVSVWLGGKCIRQMAWDAISEVGCMDYSAVSGQGAYLYFSGKALSMFAVSCFLFYARIHWRALPVCSDTPEIRRMIQNYYHGQIQHPLDPK